MSPIVARYEGEGVFAALPRFAKQCDAAFVVGEVYQLVEQEDRSESSHRQYFASIRDTWLNLPEHLADNYPTPEHLRKRALIEAGFYDEVIIDVGTAAGAVRVRQAWRAADDFAVAVARGPLVVIRTAKSQSRRAMDKATFQASKQAVLDVLATLVPQPADARAA